MSWHEERDLLMNARISELGLRVEGSELEPLVAQLYRELDACGIAFKPPIYLSDEWGCPEGVPVIGVPFYLAHPNLARLEAEIAENLETSDESMMYLRHEAGHALNYAYKLYEEEQWHETFGPYSRPYIEEYRPNPFSRDYVRHIAGWYAQKHPDEDFAETFAVWLSRDWRSEYAGTGALRKLEYVDGVMRAVGALPPRVEPTSRDLPVEQMTFTVSDYYAARAEPRVDVPAWFDGDLKQLFDVTPSAASERAELLLREKRIELIEEIAYWTGVPASVVRSLVDHLIERVEALALTFDGDEEERYLVSFTAMVTTLALNYLHHASFVPDVSPRA